MLIVRAGAAGALKWVTPHTILQEDTHGAPGDLWLAARAYFGRVVHNG